ncbi:hypothetical protein D3C86_1362760 [compost metagenome]
MVDGARQAPLHDGQDRQGDHGGQRQAPVDGACHGDEGEHQHDRRVVAGHHPFAQQAADRVEVVGGVRHQITDGAALVEARREREQVLEEALAQVELDGAGRPEDGHAPGVAKDRDHDRDPEHREAEAKGALRVDPAFAGRVDELSDEPGDAEVAEVGHHQGGESQGVAAPVTPCQAGDLAQLLSHAVFLARAGAAARCRLAEPGHYTSRPVA